LSISTFGYSNEEIRKFCPAQSPGQRLEELLSYFDHLPLYTSRHKYANTDPRNNVILVRGFWEDNSYVREWHFGHNIITTAGRIYYAKKGCGETPAANEGATRMQLANPTTQNGVAVGDTWDQFDSAVAGGGAAGTGAAIAASIITFVSTYPKTNDGDSDNTGAGTNIMSYQAFWNAASFSDGGTNIKNFAIHDNASPTGTTKLVSHGQTPTAGGVQKGGTDTLKGMVNHTVSSS